MSGELNIGKDSIYGDGPHIVLQVEVIDDDTNEDGFQHVLEKYLIKVPHNTPPSMFPVIARGHLFENDWSRDDVVVNVTQITEVKFAGIHRRIENKV